MLALFTVFSIVLWYIINWLKKFITKAELPDLWYDLIVLAIALVGGLLLAVQFRLDAFVLASEILSLTPPIEHSLTGVVFGGLVLASGSGGFFELLKALKGRPEPEQEPPK